MKVKRVAGTLGAEIGGIDLRSLSDEEVAEIRAAWLEHLVVFFRDQPLLPAEYLSFARRIGKRIEYPFVKGDRRLSRDRRGEEARPEKVNFRGIWHPTYPTYRPAHDDPNRDALKDQHRIISRTAIAAFTDVVSAQQRTMPTFFESDGQSFIDADGAGVLFEAPARAVPEDFGCIP
jgi:alpha-ketoglutarate-dependent taurine dioxygenase